MTGNLNSSSPFSPDEIPQRVITLEAFNNGDGTLLVHITSEEHIQWLRSKGVQAALCIGDVLLTGDDRKRVYPTLSEVIEPVLSRYLDALKNDYQEIIGLNGPLE